MESLATNMFSFVGKDWFFFLGACVVVVLIGYFGFSLFSMTLKVVLLWIFIAFGCGTVIYHLVNPRAKNREMKRNVQKYVKKSKVHIETLENKMAQRHLNDADIQKLYEKKRKAAEKLQQLQNNMIHDYKENILLPREAAKREKGESKFHHFNPLFKGKGQKLGYGPDGVTELTSDQLMSQIDDIYDEIIDYNQEESNVQGTSTSHDLPSNYNPMPSDEDIDHQDSIETTAAVNTEHTQEQTSLRQRKPVNYCGNEGVIKMENVLEEEPCAGEEVITLAFKCPTGKTFKRRFRKQSKLEVVLMYVSSVGYSAPRFGVFNTFPRTQLSDMTQSLCEIGITQDTSLIVDEL